MTPARPRPCESFTLHHELDDRHRKVCLAIGFFDGVHLGHQQIIRQTIADARQHEALAIVDHLR